MKKHRMLLAASLIAACLLSCQGLRNSAPQSIHTKSAEEKKMVSVYTGHVYLYGETHGKPKILEKELEIWKDYYDKGMRHLFVELPYFTAEFLNVWIKENSDTILDAVYVDWYGTADYVDVVYNFYIAIKKLCPETVFHGTDVGHHYESTGQRYLSYLKANDLEDSPQYALVQEAIQQGMVYYSSNKDPLYRENMMVKNFIRELATVDNQDIMGIYGAAHTGLENLDNSDQIPCMANQLREVLGLRIHSSNLTALGKMIEPLRVERIGLANKTYTASYYGTVDISAYSSEYTMLEFWRLEGAYADFAEKAKTGIWVSYKIYPMLVETGQVFLIEYTKKDGMREQRLYRSDGDLELGEPITVEFTLTP